MVMTYWQPNYARRAGRMKASEIRELLKLLDRPGIISFAGGIPDPKLFPEAEAAQAYVEALSGSNGATSALQYSVSEGYAPLRRWIANHMATRGVHAEADNIVITSGSQQALDFLGKLLLTPGDTALLTTPTYLGALQAFSAYEPNYDTISSGPTNRSAVTYAEAAAHAATGARVAFAYVVPDFANPTGETLSEDERSGLLDLAYDLDVPLLEDSAYSALRFEGNDQPTLQALDCRRSGSLDQSRVIYLGTFSKTVAPGLRIGWICASRAIVNHLVLLKQASDLNASGVNQIVMHRLVDGGRYEARVATARGHYRQKRDAMLRALSTYMPSAVSWTVPQGGFFVWLKVPEAVSSAELLKRAIDEANVAFVPGQAFHHDGAGSNTLRLSYSLPAESDIDIGIKRLAGLLSA
jgi:DNA-binding transcriptional MocR family regulator